jgi:hypothetical protein
VILVDASAWVIHLRAHDDTLARLLNSHPYVIGEICPGTTAAA